MPDLEGDMLRAVTALSGAVDFLRRYDRLQAALRGERAAVEPSPLTMAAEEGLAAAYRVLAGLRGGNGRGNDRGNGRGQLRAEPRIAEPRIPAQRTAYDRHGDPGE
jgi:hypothetical protein